MSKWSVAKETVTALSERASDHGADSAGMLEAEKDVAYVKNFIDYEVSSINVQHVDVQRLT